MVMEIHMGILLLLILFTMATMLAEKVNDIPCSVPERNKKISDMICDTLAGVSYLILVVFILDNFFIAVMKVNWQMRVMSIACIICISSALTYLKVVDKHKYHWLLHVIIATFAIYGFMIYSQIV